MRGRGFSSTSRIAVVGAGPSGLAAIKRLTEAGFESTVAFERQGRVGGHWVYSPEPSHSSLYESVRMISSKRLSAYPDFPFPASYPDYPDHVQMLAYFTDYARRFGLEKNIRFRTSVERAEPRAEGGWALRIRDGAGRESREDFDALVVCNGHHWSPRWPEIPGELSGRFLHSHDFKHARDLEGLRVLVIGGGNSACDIAVEASRVALSTTLSMRRGYHFVPRFLFGRPADVVASRLNRLPKSWTARLATAVFRQVQVSPASVGFARPDHRLFESHPIVGSKVLRLAERGRIRPAGDVARFDGDRVVFRDGSEDSFDVVIACTGYRISMPFFDREVVSFDDDRVELYLRVFHPAYRDLFFIGLIQPIGCIWPLSDLQARLVAAVLQGKASLPDDLEARAAREADATARAFVRSPRHAVEVEFHPYRRRLERLLRRAERREPWSPWAAAWPWTSGRP